MAGGMAARLKAAAWPPHSKTKTSLARCSQNAPPVGNHRSRSLLVISTRFRSLVAALCVALLPLNAAAQTLRRHDEERAKIARDAASQFGSGDQAAFDAMLANADVIEARDLELLAERNQLTVEATLTALP